MNHWGCLGICLISLTGIFAKTNELNKAFLHQGNFGDKVVLYFANEPIVNRVAQRDQTQENKHRHTINFFIPLAQIKSAEARKMVAALNQSKRPFYLVAVTEVTKPTNGVNVSFSFDPTALQFDYDVFDAVHTHKGVVFYMHDKQALQEVKNRSGGIKTLAQNNRLPTVAVDFGHGGHDNGKVGLFGIKEKNITYQIGTKLAQRLKKNGFNVLNVRQGDVFVPLDRRTMRANQMNADLFVSIHANAAASSAVQGIETYYTTPLLLGKPKAESLAHSFMMNREQKSKILANCIQNHVLKCASERYGLKDRKVKEATIQVLLGTDMPAALVEVGFLTNGIEAKRLANPAYQHTIAQGLFEGIREYCIQNKLS